MGWGEVVDAMASASANTSGKQTEDEEGESQQPRGRVVKHNARFENYQELDQKEQEERRDTEVKTGTQSCICEWSLGQDSASDPKQEGQEDDEENKKPVKETLWRSKQVREPRLVEKMTGIVIEEGAKQCPGTKQDTDCM